MSLDVYIKYKEPKRIEYKESGYSCVACGSTVGIYPPGYVGMEEQWHANITHNMGQMASHVEVMDQRGNKTTLYMALWRPEEIGISTTTELLPLLKEGVDKMILYKEDLLLYNPTNGWGDYDSFLEWVKAYRDACEENPDCSIESSR